MRGSVVTAGESLQVDVRSRWADGSVKFAVISGISDFRPELSLQLKEGMVADGVPIPEGKLAEILGDSDVLVSLGAFGTVSLRALVGSPQTATGASAGRVRIAATGPIMSEFHYMGIPSGGDPHLRVWFYVRVYASNAVEIETVVENGWMNVPNPSRKDYVAAIAVAGSTKSIGAVSHYVRARWSRVDWVGANPQVTPIHDGRYLMATRLLPNYVQGTPSEGAFVGSLAKAPQTFAAASAPQPMTIGPWRSTMGDAGESSDDQIGPLPHWEVVALMTGDRRAVNATIGAARQLGTFSVHFRDETTLSLPRLIDYPTRLVDTTSKSADCPYPMAYSHVPSWGFVAYLLTGRWQFWEGCAAVPTGRVFNGGPGGVYPAVDTQYARDGARGIITSQIRDRGWSLLRLAQAIAAAPDALAPATKLELQRIWANNVDYYWGLQANGTGMKNSLGVVFTYNVYATGEEVPGPVSLGAAPWQDSILNTAIALALDMEINGTSDSGASHARLAEHASRFAIGLMGKSNSGAGGFNWRRAATYAMAYCDRGTLSGVANSADWWPVNWPASWGELYQKNLALHGVRDVSDQDGLSFVGQTSGGPITFASEADITSTQAPLRGLMSLALSVDHGRTGAEAAWQRLKASSWWAANAANTVTYPRYSLAPRAL